MNASADYYVAGMSAALNGDVDWANNADVDKMTGTSTGVYTLSVSGVTLEAGYWYKYKVTDGTWDHAYGAINGTHPGQGVDDKGNAYFIAKYAGTYNITYTFYESTQTMTAEAVYLDAPEMHLANSTYWNDDDVNLMQKSSDGVYSIEINTSELTTDFGFRFSPKDWNNDCGAQYTFNDVLKDYELNLDESSSYGNSSKEFTYPTSTKPCSKIKITACFINNTLRVNAQPYVKATIGELGFATFSCDRALDFSSVSGFTAYKASVNNGKVVLSPVTEKVAAATGLLIAGASKDIPVVSTSEGADISSTNLLKASVTATNVSASTTGTYHYFLAGSNAATLGFYNLASDATSGAGKAYLETTTELSSDAATSRVAWVFADDTTTGINAIQNPQDNGILYDLQGRVAKTAKAGLYIKNGKKVLVK